LGLFWLHGQYNAWRRTAVIRFVSDKDVAYRLAQRPPEYLREIEPAIVRHRTDGIEIDTKHPAYKAAWAKYRNARPSTKPKRTRCPHLTRTCCGQPNVCGLTGADVSPADCEKCTLREKANA